MEGSGDQCPTDSHTWSVRTLWGSLHPAKHSKRPRLNANERRRIRHDFPNSRARPRRRRLRVVRLAYWQAPPGRFYLRIRSTAEFDAQNRRSVLTLRTCPSAPFGLLASTSW